MVTKFLEGMRSRAQTIGWWRERMRQGRVERRTRYTLMVSIRVPPVGVDIYTPVAVQGGIPIAMSVV
jgi:hypothetical protein